MAAYQGRYSKVTLGSNKISGMGTWSLTGVTADQVEVSQFGDNWKSFVFGMKDGGTVSISGYADPSDTTGQQALMAANLANTNITNLQIYINSTSYFMPCQTTGYFSPTTTTGADTQASYVNVTSFNMNTDKSNLLQISFDMKVSGVMVLV